MRGTSSIVFLLTKMPATDLCLLWGCGGSEGERQRESEPCAFECQWKLVGVLHYHSALFTLRCGLSLNLDW